jgi:hypothetical protein
VDDGADVQPRRLAEVASLVAVVARHRDDEVVAVDDDLGAGYAEPVDAGGDDLLRLQEGFTSWSGAVRGAGGQGYAGAALQIDAQLGLRLLVSGQKHQQIRTDE